MLSPTKDIEVEELIEGGTDEKEEEAAAPEQLLKLSELTIRSQKEIDQQQYIRKQLKDSKELIEQIMKDLADLQAVLQK